MEKTAHDIEFLSQGFLLKGVLHLPKIKHPPLVVGSHGLEGSKDSAKQLVLANLLVKNKIAFFRFDHRGCGDSQGTFITDTSLEKRTIDFIAAVQHILDLGVTRQDLAVFGSSMGGSTCINAWETLLKMDVRVCGAVLCSAPVKSRTIENIPTDATDSRPGLPLSFFKKNLLFNILDKAQHLSNVLIFHGDADNIVPVSNARDIYHRAKEPKRLIIHTNGDHQMTSTTDQRQFEQEAMAWFLHCFNQGNQVPPQ
ncbi:alpha/beta hydrolase [Desulfobacula sp.]|uniref:alpha/beta hydrolase n=1 Tax=Desulfobacula sp. TaxID=2593537 RepID=UPI00261DCAFC|nr:alpha/beta hydrolase [Desulfobacula sp.]